MGRSATASGRPGSGPGELLWAPSRERVLRSSMRHFAESVARQGHAVDPADYESLRRWSVERIEEFWPAVVEFFAVDGIPAGSTVLSTRDMPGARWFPDASVNLASHALRRRSHAAAILFANERSGIGTLSFEQLADEVARAAGAFRELGVGAGDRVVGLMPSMAETVVAFLGAASIGAAWSCCPPDFGVRSIVDRFDQLQPTVLVAVDGYTYGGKPFDRTDVVEAVRRSLPSLEHTVLVPYLDRSSRLASPAHRWSELLARAQPVAPVPLPFDHPLWILFSSGTTGSPKPIVHSHGGMLLEQLKGYGLHLDVGEADRVFWFGSTGWAVWNLLVSALVVGASVVLYDGNPAYPSIEKLWEIAATTEATVLGAGAPLYHAAMKAGLAPGERYDLGAIRTIASTGSPLALDAWRWFYRDVKEDMLLASMSGGTDVCSAFVGPCPYLPVYAGEMQCRWLGADVRAFDGRGSEVTGQVGELVVVSPMPAMPVSFWNDPTGSRYRDSYFGTYPGIWRHGDWITISDRGTSVIHGRSDATLKRSGVRMGTGDFYAVIDRMSGVRSSLVVDTAGIEAEGRLLLFVALEGDAELTEDLEQQMRGRLRTELSPRHVPDRIVQVTDVPTTLTGKKTEVPVKRILGGAAVEDVVSLDSLANPEAIEQFAALASTLGPP